MVLLQWIGEQNKQMMVMNLLIHSNLFACGRLGTARYGDEHQAKHHKSEDPGKRERQNFCIHIHSPLKQDSRVHGKTNDRLSYQLIKRIGSGSLENSKREKKTVKKDY